MDCRPPGSSVYGIFQAGILERIAFPPPGDLPNPGMEPTSPALLVNSLLLSHLGSLRVSPFYLKASTSLVAQTVKHLPAVRETQVRSLGWEDPLEKEMTTHSSTLAWKIPWTEKPGRLQSMGLQRVRHD